MPQLYAQMQYLHAGSESQVVLIRVSVAALTPRIGERPTRHWNEPLVIARRVQLESQHPVGIRVQFIGAVRPIRERAEAPWPR